MELENEYDDYGRDNYEDQNTQVSVTQSTTTEKVEPNISTEVRQPQTPDAAAPMATPEPSQSSATAKPAPPTEALLAGTTKPPTVPTEAPTVAATTKSSLPASQKSLGQSPTTRQPETPAPTPSKSTQPPALTTETKLNPLPVEFPAQSRSVLLVPNRATLTFVTVAFVLLCYSKWRSFVNWTDCLHRFHWCW